MDLNPDAGEYRFQATVPEVEVNALRETLGVRPLPFPLAGALRGTLFCTGPLEEPSFSGDATHSSKWLDLLYCPEGYSYLSLTARFCGDVKEPRHSTLLRAAT